jgi:hypothetical protein
MLFVLAQGMWAQQETSSKVLQICILHLENSCRSGPEYSAEFAERDLLTEKLNLPGSIGIEAKVVDGESQLKKLSCDYLAYLSQVGVERNGPRQAPGFQNGLVSHPDHQGEPSEIFREEPLDQAFLSVQLYGCRSRRPLLNKELTELRQMDGAPSKQTVDWLTEEAAKKIRLAIAKDLKTHPGTTNPLACGSE